MIARQRDADAAVASRAAQPHVADVAERLSRRREYARRNSAQMAQRKID
jgi:hypothetical protein